MTSKGIEQAVTKVRFAILATIFSGLQEMRLSCGGGRPIWLSIIMIILLSGPFLFAQQRKEVTGKYIEVRSNHVYGSYCEWSGEAVTGGREAVLAWDVEAGECDGVSLSGAKIVAVLVGQSNLSDESTPRRCVVLLDSAAPDSQRQAVQHLLQDHYGKLLGHLLKTYAVPIEYYWGNDQANVRIGELLTLSMRRARLPEDAMRGAQHWYDPFIPLTEFTLGTTLKNSVHCEDFGLHWDVSRAGTTGYYGRFRLVSQ